VPQTKQSAPWFSARPNSVTYHHSLNTKFARCISQIFHGESPMTSGVENDSAETTPGSLSKIPAQKQSFWVLPLVFIATIALAVRLLTLISHYAANVFFMDQ
jgi:hypothetical protein